MTTPTTTPAAPLTGAALINSLLDPKASAGAVAPAAPAAAAPRPKAEDAKDDEKADEKKAKAMTEEEERKMLADLKAKYEKDEGEEEEAGAKAVTIVQARALIGDRLPADVADRLVLKALETKMDKFTLMGVVHDASAELRERRRTQLNDEHRGGTPIALGSATPAPHATWEEAKNAALARGEPLGQAIAFANSFKQLRERKFGTEEQRRGVPAEG